MSQITSKGRRILDKKIRTFPVGFTSRKVAGHEIKYITVFSAGFFLCREQRPECLRRN
ncbi:CHS_3a_G0020270.mRNA.1.CDS.1 [Saccharomyces cerevisiae]|nr:BCN_G0021920.mRNA.1.CDS.1 [Saccharomyces cerevisiae]CAI4467086.1 BCE_3a_G0021790.mRNA.1.CDS.1 [Saccharomyces cerevisiae]CAI4480202.1 ABA_G0020890.mRNA.1.CDS.1 [Saccharomyces cerevisiae]CAI4883936.1 CHS_3a_G0020270.mRNA.1.CDS.1 [Saccharomyces cerevisiae]CAI6682471.1 ABA_G0020890.mRNA.1.CDS.1 [Saccharomyces cerevisiae]